MLTIRLRRHGAKRDPHYRVVVTEDSDSRDGPFLEIVGHYHPRKQPAEIVLDLERTEEWVGKGARMSDTVASLYKRVKSGKVEGAVGAADVPGKTADREVEKAQEPQEETAAESAAAADADSSGDAEEESAGDEEE